MCFSSVKWFIYVLNPGQVGAVHLWQSLQVLYLGWCQHFSCWMPSALHCQTLPVVSCFPGQPNQCADYCTTTTS